jgi:hypothetical protein
MPFILPKGAAREYLTVNGIIAIYIAEHDDEVDLGISRDLYQSLLAIRRLRRYAAIVAAYWLHSEAAAEAICAAVVEDTAGSRMTPAAVANRIEAAAERLNIPLTDHQTLLLRTQSAVAYIDERLAEAQANGSLRFFNQYYRAWRIEAKLQGRSMTYAEARARLRRSLYRQIASGEPSEVAFPRLPGSIAVAAAAISPDFLFGSVAPST